MTLEWEEKDGILIAKETKEELSADEWLKEELRNIERLYIEGMISKEDYLVHHRRIIKVFEDKIVKEQQRDLPREFIYGETSTSNTY